MGRHAKQAGPAVAADPSRLTDEEADFVLKQLVTFAAPFVNGPLLFGAFGVGATVGVRDDSRERAREWVRMFVTMER